MRYSNEHKLVYELGCLDLLQGRHHFGGCRPLTDAEKHIRYLYNVEYRGTNYRGQANNNNR